jgi:polygalacturonase
MYPSFVRVVLFLSSVAVLSAADRSVRDFGAKGDGQTLDTAAINQAIETVANEGGGTVLLPPGEYLSYSIRLRSNITLRIDAGATLIAAEPPPAGQPGGYDYPEPNEWEHYQDFGHTHFKNSLIWGEGLENVAIVGQGRIYGRGLSRGNGRVALPVGVMLPVDPKGPLPIVLDADGPFEVEPRPDLKTGPFKYPNARDRLPDGVGNKAIALANCHNVTLRDFSILHGGHFAILATGVDNLTIDNLLIDTNRDGIDIDACSNVRLTNTSVNAPWDDGICIKSSYALGYRRVTENVTISNCLVSGYDEGTLLDGTRQKKMIKRGGAQGRIKLGTESNGGYRNIAITNCVFDYSRGIALEQVDGGVMEDIVISNITMRDVHNAPIFIRLGGRLRSPDDQKGTTQRISISNITAYNVAPEHGILISGLIGQPIKDVSISNVQLYYRGGGTEEQAKRVVPEYVKAYPDPYNFGTIPSWGMFARHVENLAVRNVDFHLMAPDARPAIILDDAVGVRLAGIKLPTLEAAQWRLNAVTNLKVFDCDGLADTAPTLPIGHAVGSSH